MTHPLFLMGQNTFSTSELFSTAACQLLSISHIPSATGSFTSAVPVMLPPEQAAPYFQTSWYTSPGAALTTAGASRRSFRWRQNPAAFPGFMSNMESSLRTALVAFGSIIMDPLRNVKEQTREQKLVAQIPLPPLWFLMALCMLYTMLGLLVSLFTLRDCSPSARDIRDRLSVKGVVANCCRVPRYDLPNLDVSESFFAEDGEIEPQDRIAIVRSARRGWVLDLRDEEGNDATAEAIDGV